MSNRAESTRRGTVPLLAAGVAVLLAGCSLEVLNPGRILDQDLNDPDLMDIVVNGASSEFNDFMDDYAFDVATLTDEMAGSGSYFTTGRFRRGVYDNEDSRGNWEQIHESAWTAGEAILRMQEVLAEQANSSPQAAKAYTLMGHTHRTLGEAFCEVVYDEGPIQPRTAAFDSAVADFNMAIQIAGSNSDAAAWKMASIAGLAQAYVGLGNWGKAVENAAMVPTDFVAAAHYNRTADENLIYNETWGRAELSVYGTLAGSLAEPDPRAPYTKCGVFKDPNDPSQGVDKTNAPGCTAHQGADGLTAHWRQDKFDDYGSDIPYATGAEMRLIEAEKALRDGDLATFTTKVNEERAFYGMDPIDQPATAGALEYPNANDDAWSILDRERYFVLWLDGRRMWDLDRWDHPFLNGGSVVYPGESRRVSCMPIPEIECQLNPNLQGSSECG